MSEEYKITDAAKKKLKKASSALMGYKVDESELRLMAYIQSVMTNEQHLEPGKINITDITTIERWVNDQHISFTEDSKTIIITKHFWDIINELIYIGYVDRQ